MFELENLKKQQANILQLQIDNESIKEKRVADFKNPNKPPPIPEQYKTASEIQKDVMTQQKITIDHLKSLGLDNFLASQVAIDMAKLAEGDGAFYKFNSYFPAFKKKIENNRNLKTLVDSTQIISLIRIFFDEIDESNGLNVGTSTSTNYFDNTTKIASTLLPSKELYQLILEILAKGYSVYRNDIDSKKVMGLISLLTDFETVSLSSNEIGEIESLPNFEKTSVNKLVSKLISTYNLPTGIILGGIVDKFNETNDMEEIVLQPSEDVKDDATYIAFAKFVNSLEGEFRGINKKTENKLLELNFKIKSMVKGREVALSELTGKVNAPQVEQVINSPENQLQFIKNQMENASHEYLMDNINYFSRNNDVIFPKEMGYSQNKLFEDEYALGYPTIDGEFPNGKRDSQDNVIYETEKRGGKHAIPVKVYLRNGQEINLGEGGEGEQGEGDGWYYYRQFNPSSAKWEIYNGEYKDGNDISYFLKYRPTNDMNGPALPRYTRKQLNELIKEHELPALRQKLRKDKNYLPADYPHTRIFPARNDEGEPLTEGPTLGWGVKPKTKKRKSKKSKKESSSESSSDEDKKIRDIHIDINSHDGKNYKMSGDGFIKRRIKIGKGLEVRNDEPKFRQFGKYIIHMPQLRNNNILNLKHKSGGSIPSIKPVYIEDNFKEFIIDILDSGRVNDRHYQSLTEPEQNHFLKAVRGAGIIDDLKLKTKNHDKEQEEIKRLELLLGEVNAGNDNAGILKEARTLIKKYVSNGRISRQKGLDMLLELE
jgi:hypothetical protein